MPSAGWYLRRLKAMSIPEVSFRVRRAVSMQLERLPFPHRRVPSGLSGGSDEALLLPAPDTDPAPYVARARKLLQGEMDVFSLHGFALGNPPEWNRDPRTGVLAPLKPGKLIDYRDEKVVGDIKYLWEPSRHLELAALAQAYALSGDRAFADGLVRFIESWIDQCPYPRGAQWCSSLEVGIRAINWSLAWRILGGREGCLGAGMTEAFIDRWLESVYRHMQFIDGYYSGYSSANNHLIGEAAGVYVASVTWPGWKACGKWRRRARGILIREMDRQTWPDGVNREQAISYQQFVLDFFLLAGSAGEKSGEPFPEDYWNTFGKMLDFVASAMDAAGNVPMIGDADDGYVVKLSPERGFCNFRSLLATGAMRFDRPDFAAKAGGLDAKSRWLNEDAAERFRAVVARADPRGTPVRAFPHGGYFVLGQNFDRPDEVRILFDAGPLGMGSIAAHGHADALSFTLSVRGTPVIVDPGTYAYHTQKKWRDYFRGTSAHNTVRVDGADQSVIGGNFMWSRHAAVTVHDSRLEDALQFVDASHDGYRRLDDPVSHRRRLAYDAGAREIVIEDGIDCKGGHGVELFFQFPEYARVQAADDGVDVVCGASRIRLRPEHALEPAVLHADEAGPHGWISYRFDSREPAWTLRYAGRIDGPAVLRTVIAID